MLKKILGGVAGKAAVLAVLVSVGMLVAGSAGASAKHRGLDTTIKIKQKPSGKPYFDVPGDGTVVPGANLTIVNKTNPRKIGPHTFSLVTSDVRPHGPQEKKDCGKLKEGTICNVAAFDWHQVTFSQNSFHVGQKNVEAGNPGWDTEGDLNNTGDSQFISKQDQSFSRSVSAAPATVLHFMCIVHPEMQGKVTVGPPR